MQIRKRLYMAFAMCHFVGGSLVFAKSNEPLEVPIKTFVVFVTEPTTFKMENRAINPFGGVGLTVHAIRNKNMANALSAEIAKQGKSLANIVRVELSNGLKAAGLEEIAQPDANLNHDNPSKVDYKNIKTDADAIIHVFFEEVGLLSSTLSTTYEARLFAKICVVVPLMDDDCEFDEEATYGNGIKNDEALEFRSNPADRWTNEDDVFARIDTVANAFADGAKKIGAGYAAEILREQLKTKRSVPEIALPMVSATSSVQTAPSPTPIEKPVDTTTIPAPSVVISNQAEKPESVTARRLRELKELRKEGLITEREYNEKRKAVLADL